jgi:hypothetical protein
MWKEFESKDRSVVGERRLLDLFCTGIARRIGSLLAIERKHAVFRI